MKMSPYLKGITAIVITCLLCTGYAYGLPKIDEVVAGEVKIEVTDPSTMNITASDNTIINYSSFNILENESVFITLPSVESSILNRDIGGSPSDLLGNLSCNGLFILVNESGIYVGPNANIDAASLVLSTRDITNPDFLSGNYMFRKLSEEEVNALLLNEGSVNIRPGGFGAFISGAIENRGVIATSIGRIALAGGDAVKLDISGNGLISVIIEEPVARTILDFQGNPITDQIRNTGSIEAAGGAVILKAESLRGILKRSINLEGAVRADRVENIAGEIIITADGDVESTGAIEAVGGTINIDTEGAVQSLGVLKAESFLEKGASLFLGGTYEVGKAVVRNADGAVTLDTGNYAGETSDVANIIVNDDAVITLTGDTIFRADSNTDGTGYFTMNAGSSIVGQANDLTLYSSQDGTLRAMTGSGTLTIRESQNASNPTYTLANNLTDGSEFALSLISGTLSTGGKTLTMDSYFQTGGTFTAGASNIFCRGNYSVTGGTYNANTSVLTLDATDGDLNFTGGGYTFNDVIFKNISAANDRIITLGNGTFTFNGDVYLFGAAAGALTVDAATNNPNLTIAGNLQASTFDIAGDAAATLEAGKAGGDKWGASLDPVVLSDVDLATYYGISGSKAAIVQYEWSAAYGAKTVRIYFSNNSPSAPGNYSFEYHDGAAWVAPAEWQSGGGSQGLGAWHEFTLPNAVDSTKIRLRRPAGGAGTGLGVSLWQLVPSIGAGDKTINAGSGTWTIGGNADLTGVTLERGTSEFVFNATDADNTITSAAQSFHDVTFNGVGGTWTLQDAFDANNDLAITNGTLACGANAVNIGGSFNNADTFTTAGTWTFDATAAGKTITSTRTNFNDLIFNGVGGGWTLQDVTTADGSVTLTNGTLNLNGKTLTMDSYSQTGGTLTAGASNIFCKGNYSVTGGTYNANTSVLTLDATDGNLNFMGGGYTFNDVIFKNISAANNRTVTLGPGNFIFNGDFSLFGAAAGALTIDGLTYNPDIAVAGDLTAAVFNIAGDAAATLEAGKAGGDKWGASLDPVVLSDVDLATYYGISGSKAAIVQYEWSAAYGAKTVRIYFSNNSPSAPGNYSFEYHDGAAWVAPAEWQSGGGSQGLGAWHEFTLPNAVDSTKIRLRRPATGAGTGLGVSEWQLVPSIGAGDKTINAGSGQWTVTGAKDTTNINWVFPSPPPEQISSETVEGAIREVDSLSQEMLSHETNMENYGINMGTTGDRYFSIGGNLGTEHGFDMSFILSQLPHSTE